MFAMPLGRPTDVNYDQRAASYARHRGVHEGVLRELIDGGRVDANSRVLDVGCGTGNYARALKAITGCPISGVEPSAEMRSRAADTTIWEKLVAGRAEQLPFADGQFDLVMTTDVIHHVGNRDAYFHEAARMLAPDGKIVTVTDSHADLARRRPLTSYFPETLAIEIARYPDIAILISEMTAAGFAGVRMVETAREYEIIDIAPYRDRAFSSLVLLDEDAFRRGVDRMERDLARGPIAALSLYTLIWGELPRH
jgi:SAM-dependent methyltransferase